MKIESVLALAFLFQINCLKLSNYCSYQEINNFNETTSHCNTNYMKCHENICAVDNTSCQEFKVFSMSLGRKDRPLYAKWKNAYQKLIDGIYDCDEIQHGVCRKHLKCLATKQGLSFRFGMNIVKFKQEWCPCSGQFEIDCGDHYCALKKSDCEDLQKKNVQLKDIKKCMNLSFLKY